jgi:hypothetical protein
MLYVTFPKLEEELDVMFPFPSSLLTMMVLDAPNDSVPLNIVVVHAEVLLFVYVPPLFIVKKPFEVIVIAEEAVKLPPLRIVREPTEVAEEFVTVPPMITLSQVPGAPAGLHVALLHVAPLTHVFAL